MSGADGLIVTLPLGGDEALHWWRLDGGVITQRGQDGDVRDAAGLPSAVPGERIMALVPTELTHVSWLQFDDLKPRQAEGAARIEAARRGIGGTERNHAAARALEDAAGTVLAATIAPAALSGGLAHLQAIGIDPDVVTPLGLIIAAEEGQWTRADVAGEQFLRGARAIIPDEPALIAAILGEVEAVDLNQDESDAALEIAFAEPALNLRQGRFAKRRKVEGLGKREWQIIALTLSLALLATVLIALVSLVKYTLGADQQNAAALSTVRAAVPEAADLETAERLLDQRLIAGGGGASFGPAAAALFQTVRGVPEVSIRRLAYAPDGTLSATLGAAQPDQLNRVLVPLQANLGYVITQTPRQAADGMSLIDITVRTP